MPRRPRRPAARARAPLGVRRTRPHRPDRRPPRRRRRRGGRAPPALRRPVPDPADGAGGRLRRERLPLDRGGQHVRLQLPPGRGDESLVRARLRPRDRPQPDREPLRLLGRHQLPPGEPAVSAPLAVQTGMAVEGGASYAPSRRSAGRGAGASAASRTTSTSPRAVGDRRRRAPRRGRAPGDGLARSRRASHRRDGPAPARCVRRRVGAARARALGALALRVGRAVAAPPRARAHDARPGRRHEGGARSARVCARRSPRSGGPGGAGRASSSASRWSSASATPSSSA